MPPDPTSPAANPAHPRPVYVFDLDGTLLSCNSFPLWAMHMLRGRVPHRGRARQAATSLAVARLLLRRKLGRLRHAALKQRLQAIWQHATAGDAGTHAERLGHSLERYLRPNMAEMLRQVRAGEVDAVLATAAAGEYAHALGRRLGFDAVLASDDGSDNLGEEKSRRVLAFLAERNWSARPRIVFTDHLDDLPLMRACDAVCWFGPDNEHADIARQLPGIATVAGRSLDSYAVSAAVSRFCAVRLPA